MSDRASKQSYDPATYRSGKRPDGLTTDVFSSNIPHRAPLLCYIAGIECPIVAAQVSYGVWKIPEASITMFPDIQLQRFGAEDRVPVALFYLDEYIEPEKPTWRLLFEGEIVGWSYMNTVGSRSLQFQCVMNIAMWTQLFIFYMTSLSSVAQGIAATSGDPSAKKQAQAVPGFSLFRRGLLIPKDKQDNPSEEDYVKRPFDLAYNVVRSLISNKVPTKQRCVPGINFFARWTRREQFHNRWVALPFLEEPTTTTADGGEVVETDAPGIFPVLRASQSLQAVRAVENQVFDKYSGGSIYTILKQVLDSMLMELVMLPTAPCVQARTDGVIRGEPVFRTEGQKIAAKTEATLTAHKTALTNARTSPVVVTPELTDALYAAGVGYTFGDKVTLSLVERALQNVNEKLSVSLDTGPADASLPTRLGNYFIKPQMLFGLPPNCNVIFPSMTPQISYQENYVTQPTRFYLQDDAALQYAGLNDPKNADLKTTMLNALSRAYPPSVDRKWTGHMEKGQGAKSGRNLLVWPEEFFKGPVTARQPAPPWLCFVAAQGQGQGKKSGTPTGKVNDKSTKADSTQANDPDKTSLTDQDVYALYAQYEYFRSRFAARNGAVACAFHPYLVPGFPLAVFDDFQSRLHTIGYLMNVTHQFGSRSVSTSLNYGYGRTLYEFFDLLANELDTGGAVAERKGLAMAAAPAEPIKEIRDVIQHFYKAEQFYQTLLHRRQSVPAVFEYRDLIALVKGDGTLEDIQIEGVNEEAIAARKKELETARDALSSLLKSPTAERQRFIAGDLSETRSEQIRSAIDFASGGVLGTGYERIVGSLRLEDYISRLQARIDELNDPTVTHNLSDVLNREFAPKPGAEPYFDSYDAAMRYCARPICTLDEYIQFIRGVAESPQDDWAYSTGAGAPSARYYARIRRMTGAPADFEPTKEQQGLTEAPQAIDPREESTFPELRAEWERSLLAYRRNVYATTEVQR